MHSGYASSSISSKSYRRALQDAYNDWKMADDASQRVAGEERTAEECKRDLTNAKKYVEQMHAQRSPLRGLRKKKPSFLNLLGRNKNTSLAHLPIQPVPSAPIDLIEASVHVDELERRMYVLTKQIEATKTAAAKLDNCFEALRNTLDSGPLPSWRYTLGNEDAIARAEKSVAAREEAYNDSLTMTESFKRGRLAAQSAHHHYAQAMDLVDTVCSPKKNTWEAALGDEQSREQTYREAGSWAQKAQVCFNECLRVLEPYQDLLGRDELEDCDELKRAGLLQAVRLYELMYGGKALAFGITQQVQIMLQKQTAVFERLTRLAVGVQNFTTHCETVQQAARNQRDHARRHVVALWMNDGSAYASLSPMSSPPSSPSAGNSNSGMVL
ncbi:hypothetical protein AcW1_001465 [Taiwanofungus camphoratus]|nr:hypothetical protein AcV7_001488 [Antrodia cinnamomea]KAI0964701.1 hypothetical protein AcW1_001465 [Antrodia cinnamomea]